MKKFDTVKLDKILEKFDLHTTDYKEFKLAFTHSTYANENNCISNERVEFIGDGLLNMFTAIYIYENYPTMKEGQMSKLRAEYVCEDANYKYAMSLGLNELLLLGNGEEAQGGRNKVAVVADTFECFLAAVYKTFGFDAVGKILEVVVYPHIKNQDVKPFIDYKTKLQELVQGETKDTVEYILVKEEGKPNDKTYTFAAKVEGIIYGVGVGKSKKDAQQQAAKAALLKLAK